MKHPLKMLLLLLLPLSAMAQQTYTVRGTLIEATYNMGIPLANVGLFRASDTVFMRGATTTMDMTGAFEIHDVAPGTYLMKVTAPGFPVYWDDLTVASDTTLTPIPMSVDMQMLKSATVTASRPLYSMDGEKNIYSTADDPTVQSGTAADALRAAPGVKVDAQVNISLRGVGSVEVWINGQPCHLDQESLRQYIKTLPASAVDKIEVITNPSARYSSKGGVINIVTGTKIMKNDFLSISLFGDSKPEGGPWLSYVHGNDKLTLNLYGGADIRYNRFSSETAYTMLNPGRDTTETYSQRYKSSTQGNGFFVGGNFSYNFSDNTTLSAWLGTFLDYSGVTSDDTAYRTFYHPLLQQQYANSLSANGFNYGGYGGLNFEHRIDTLGQKISVSANGSLFGAVSHDTTSRLFLLGSGMDLRYATRYTHLGGSGSIEANYTKPFSKNSELEVGAEYGFTPGPTSMDWDNYDFGSQTWQRDDLRTYSLKGQDHKLGAYATYLHRFGNFTAKVGLRAEEAMLHAALSGMHPASLDTAIFSFVPSIHLTYRTEKMDNFKLNYTRRTATPGALQLMDHTIYSLESFSKGNPALRCSYTHNMEAGWTRFIPKFGSVGIDLYYRANTDEVQSLSDVVYDPILGRIVAFTQPINVGNSSTLGGSADVTIHPGGFFTVNLSANVFENHYRAEYRPGEWEEHSKLSFSTRLSAWTKLWKCLDVFAMFNYVSPTQSLLAESGQSFFLDIGIDANLLDRRLSIFLGVNDPFNWNATTSDILNPYYTYTSTVRRLSRAITFGVTYRLGKMELESRAQSRR